MRQRNSRRITLQFICIGLFILLFAHMPAPGPAQGQAPETRAIYVEAMAWLNVRYGPGLDYPRIGRIYKGQRYRVLRRDADLEWLEIAYPEFAGGRGWVYRAGVLASGRLDDIPVISDTTFDYPTLTPMPPAVVTSAAPWSVTPMGMPGQFAELAQSVYELLVSRGFRPGTERVGSAFLMDLLTGERHSLYPHVAYSGMSLIKIPILVAFYRKIASVPTFEQAQQLALMIVCSENLSADAILRFLGDGDPYQGVAYVTRTMQALGLRDTLLQSPFVIEPLPSGLNPTPPAYIGQSTADQLATSPDPYNQTTPADLGWLLSGIYQCALDGSGPLPSAFPGTLTEQKCRGMLRALRADDIPALIRAGVPEGIEVAHKHGWVDEVHGDAGIVFSPGTDYVLVVMLRNETWLEYADSFPTIAEISRMVFNYFNPADWLPAAYTEPVPLCGLGSIDPTLFGDLLSESLPPIR